MSIKFLVFWGGGGNFGLGGGKCRFYFYGRGDFSEIFIAHQADSHESLEFPIRANHPIRTNRANRFARITPLSFGSSRKSA